MNILDHIHIDFCECVFVSCVSMQRDICSCVWYLVMKASRSHKIMLLCILLREVTAGNELTELDAIVQVCVMHIPNIYDGSEQYLMTFSLPDSGNPSQYSQTVGHSGNPLSERASK